MGDKVAILGTVPNSRCIAPYDDPSWDIWCCSGGNSQSAAPPRVTEWFEIHSLVDLHAPENQSWYPQYAKWLNEQKFTVWMQEKNEDIPRAQVFPRRPLMERFGPNKTMTNWFTSSPAWMFGFAIHRGYKSIGVFGVDMAAAEEHYTGQKAGLLRWFEIGRELGVKVHVPLESTLAFHYPLYGYAESSRAGRALLVRENELKIQIANLERQWQMASNQIAAYRGSLEQVIFDRRTYVSGIHDAEIDEEQVTEAVPTVMVSGRNQDLRSKELPLPPAVAAPWPMPTAADFPDSSDAVALLRAARPNQKGNGSQAYAQAGPSPPIGKTMTEVSGTPLKLEE